MNSNYQVDPTSTFDNMKVMLVIHGEQNELELLKEKIDNE